jgi:hypothetical protein
MTQSVLALFYFVAGLTLLNQSLTDTTIAISRRVLLAAFVGVMFFLAVFHLKIARLIRKRS